MKKLFKVFVLLMALCLCFTAFGCDFGGGDKDQEPSNQLVDNGIKYTILSETEVEVNGLEKNTTQIVIPEKVSNYTVIGVGEEAFNYKKLITKVTLPQTVTYLKNSAFRNCEKLETINLGNVSVIESNCFKDCKAIRVVSLASATSIGNAAFQNCSKLLQVTIPATVTELKSSTFASCRILNTVTFEGDIEKVGTNCFSACSLLSNINIGKIKIFEESSFNACVGLTDIVLTNVVEVRNMAFQSCDGLKTIAFGENCIFINKNAFNKCVGLTSIDFLNKSGWISVGTCARCANTEWASNLKAESLEDPTNNVSKVVAGDWAHNQYLCKDAWVQVNRPNGWNVHKGDYCEGCRLGK